MAKNALQLVKSAQFNGVTFDCYAQENETSDFWATRTQIGQILEYENPRDAIKDIHNRHQERLDKFSTQRNLRLHEENRTVTREVILYNFKGLLEICRYSNQPKADAVMDFLWNIADEIRRTGSYLANNNKPAPAFLGVVYEARAVFESAGITGNQMTLALDKLYRKFAGESALLTAGIELEAPTKEQALTPSELAEFMGIGTGKAGARLVNRMLEEQGFQRRVGKYWEPTEKGKQYAVVLDTGKQHSDGTPVRQVKWDTGTADNIRR